MRIFKEKIVCTSCGGTGLYVGMAEREGAAVVCHKCNGTGCFEHEFKYVLFEERVLRKDVKRVFKTSCGYGHSAIDRTSKEGTVIEFSKAGVAYEDWLKGEKPKPVKTLYCPYLWENQNIQDSNHPCHKTLFSTKCEDGLSLGCSVTSCKFYGEKSKCWEIFEK
jgi:hypothetical protein